MSDERDISEKAYSRRTAMKAGAATVAASGLAGAAAAEGNGPPDKDACEPPYEHPADVDATNVFDASQPTVRVDNKLDCPMQIMLVGQGSFDGMVVTVGPRHSGYRGKEDGYPNQTGKYVKLPQSDCGKPITGLYAKLPQAKDFSPVSGFGTATIGGEGCD